VLYESAAASLPFIASECGNAKEIAQWTQGGLIVKTNTLKHGYVKADVNDAARAIEKLACDSELRDQLGGQSRKNWQDKYTWEKAIRKIH